MILSGLSVLSSMFIIRFHFNKKQTPKLLSKLCCGKNQTTNDVPNQTESENKEWRKIANRLNYILLLIFSIIITIVSLTMLNILPLSPNNACFQSNFSSYT